MINKKSISDAETKMLEIFTLVSKGFSSDTLEQTKQLLGLYRLSIWNLNCAAREIKSDLEYVSGNADSGIHTYVQLLRAADSCGYDIRRTWIHGRLRSMGKTSALLDAMKHALALVREFPLDGETYYDVLFYNYFASGFNERTASVDTMRRLGYHSSALYYKHKKEALELYDLVFWRTISEYDSLEMVSS